jgi:hypothetical protein
MTQRASLHVCMGEGRLNKNEFLLQIESFVKFVSSYITSFISILGSTPIRKRFPVKFTKFHCTMHKIDCYNDTKTLLLKGHVQTFPPWIIVQTVFLPAFSQTFPRQTLSETILFWELCQDPSNLSDQAGTLMTLIEQEDKHFDSRPGNPLTVIFHGGVSPPVAIYSRAKHV